ncbi:hypothetical protein BY996DRAFT_7145880 [Phakopsora pachyrhizi]|nr:hypothetical protein BY996DRAFT_7145880 [Phakopsora pachyrhizi]
MNNSSESLGGQQSNTNTTNNNSSNFWSTAATTTVGFGQIDGQQTIDWNSLQLAVDQLNSSNQSVNNYQNQNQYSLNHNHHSSTAGVNDRTDQIFSLLSSLRPINYPTTSNSHQLLPSSSTQSSSNKRSIELYRGFESLGSSDETLRTGEDDEYRKRLKQGPSNPAPRQLEEVDRFLLEEDQSFSTDNFGDEALRTRLTGSLGLSKPPVTTDETSLPRGSSGEREELGRSQEDGRKDLVEQTGLADKRKDAINCTKDGTTAEISEEEREVRMMIDGFKRMKTFGIVKQRLNEMKDRQDELELRLKDERNRLKYRIEKSASSNLELKNFDRQVLLKWDQLRSKQLDLLRTVKSF